MNKLLALYGIFDISNMFITTEGGKDNQRKPQDLATIETGEPAHNLVIGTVNSTKAICRSFPWGAKTRELLIFNRGPPGWRVRRFYLPLTAPD